MTFRRYRESLTKAVSQIDVNQDLQNDRRLFLTWLLTLIVLDEDLSFARAIFPSLLDRPKETERPGADLIAWASLAFSGLLLEEPWEREAELGLARIEPTLTAFGNDARFLEPAMGLYMLVGEEVSASRLWGRRMAVPLGENTAAVGFEALYLSSLYAREFPLSYLAPSFARIVAKIHQIPISITSIAHLGAGFRLTNANASMLRESIKGAADKLDKLVYGERGATPVLQWGEAVIECLDTTHCRITLEVSGSGRLHPGAQEVGPLSFFLPEIIETLIEQPKRSCIQCIRSLFNDHGHLEVMLSLPDNVKVQKEDINGLESRLALAWEHIGKLHPGLKAKAFLVVENKTEKN